MGGAYTAIAEDGSAVFYNPAALAQPGFTYTYGNPDSVQKNYNGTFTFAKLGYLGYGAYSLKNIGTDEVSATIIGFSNRSGWLNWGFNYKELGWTLSGTTASGWSTDFGFLARITPQLKIGILAQDILTSKDTPLPASGRVGFGFRPMDGSLTVAGDVEIQKSLQTYGHFGIEANISEGLSLRGGVDRGDATLGLTLDFSAFAFDYAVRVAPDNSVTHSFETGIRALPQRERPFSMIKPKEYALIDIRGTLKGGRTEYSLFGGVRPGLDSLLVQIRRASKDSSINGIMLRLGGFSGGLGGMAVVQEIRSELKKAAESGKKIVAYLEGSALGEEYYLAAMADKIVAPPGVAIGGLSKSVTIYRVRGFFDKLGVDWQVFKQGKYKDALGPFNTAMSGEQQEMIEGLVADLYRQMLTDIAKDRGIGLDEIKELGNGMVFTPKEAQALGLIDSVGYYKDARKLAAEILGEEQKEAKMVKPNLFEPEESFLTRVFGVAVIEIDGELVSGSSGENIIFGGRYVGSDSIVEYIHKASDDVFVKAIILRINSPGGSPVASGEIYKALQYAREKNKVIIASIGDIGASGGYYIAAAADKIVADPASLTGSIGVIGYFPVFKQLMKKLNVSTDVIKEGEHADMFSGMRELTEEEAAAIGRLQADVYDEFIQAVVLGRGLSTQEVEQAAQGRLYTGSQAKELKLVDELGGFSEAVDLAKQEAKISGEPRLIFYHQGGFLFPFGAGNVVNLLGIDHL